MPLIIFPRQAECPQCKGKYSNLSQHIHKVHLKTKNVMCDKCGQTFYHVSNLKRHVESVHTLKTAAPAAQPAAYQQHTVQHHQQVYVLENKSKEGRPLLIGYLVLNLIIKPLIHIHLYVQLGLRMLLKTQHNAKPNKTLDTVEV